MKYIYNLKSLLSLFMLLFSLGNIQAQTLSGTGTEEDPYIVNSNDDLIELYSNTTYWSGYISLTSDLDMDGQVFHPIGYKPAGIDAITFTGTFNGNFHVIENLTITPHDDNGDNSLGFIGYSQNGTIKNLGILNLNFDSRSYARVGGIVGFAQNTTIIDRCFVLGGNITANGNIGGIAGQMDGQSITNCISNITYASNGWGNDTGLVGKIDAMYPNTVLSTSINYGDNRALMPDGRIGGAADRDFSGLYAIQTSTNANESSYVTVLTSMEMTDVNNFPDLDFSETGAWEMRENSYPVLKGFPASAFASLKSYTPVPLKITSNGTDPIVGATITIDGTDYTTDAEGMSPELLDEGVYDYTVNADGYQEYMGSFTIDETTSLTTITLVPAGIPTYTTSIIVNNNKGELLEGAEVSITNNDTYTEEGTTDSNGEVAFELMVNGTYDVSVTKAIHETYTGTITVADANVNETITMTVINIAPVAVVQSNFSVESNQLVTLDGTASYDENNDDLTYDWTAPDGITLSSTTEGMPTFTAPAVTQNTNYTFTLTVNDGTVTSEIASVTVTVKEKIINGENILVNGSFEEELTVGWMGTAAYERSNEIAGDALGAYSLYINEVNRIDALETSEDSRFDLTIGKSYTLSGRVRVDQMDVPVFNIRLIPNGEWPADGKDNYKIAITDPSIDWGDYSVTLGEWLYFEKTLLIDEEYTSQVVSNGDMVTSRVYFQSPNGANAQIYLDDFKLIENDVDLNLNAGEDITTTPGSTINLNASINSSDPFVYTWTATEGVTLSSNDQLSTSVTVDENITEEVSYTLSITATLGEFSVSDEVVVTVLPSMTASAGEDQSVEAGEIVTLDASGTEPAQSTLLWTAPEGIELSDVNAVMPTFTAPTVAVSTTYTFTLTASLGEQSEMDEVIITVNPSTIPVADAGENQTVFVGNLVTLDGSNSMAQTANELVYNWVAPEGIELSDATIAMPTFTAPFVEDPTDFEFTLTVTDGDQTSAVATVVITVMRSGILGNEIIVNGGFEEELTVGWSGLGSYTRSDVVSEDSEGSSSLFIEEAGRVDAVQTNEESFFDIKIGSHYKLSGRFRIDQMEVPVFNIRIMPDGEWPAPEVDNYKVAFTNEGITWGDVTVRIGEWIYFEKTILFDEAYTVQDVAVGDAITSKLYMQSPDNANIIAYLDDFSLVESGIDFELTLGDDFSVLPGMTVDLIGSHNSSSDFTYTWVAPEGITLSNSDQLATSFVAPSDITEETSYTFTLTATLGEYSTTESVTVTVLPSITASAGEDQEVDAGDYVMLDATGTMPSQATLVWTVPEEIELSDVNGITPTFTAPIVSEITEFTLTLTATLGEISATDEVVITVNPSVIPIANAGNDRVAYVGGLVTLDASNSISQTDGALTYNWKAPEGITLSDASSSMPTFIAPEVEEPTDFVFNLTVSDGTNTSPEVSVTITVMNSYLSGEELIINGGFEEELTVGWSGLTNYTRSDVVSEDSEGSSSLYIEEPGRVDAVQTNEESFFDIKIGSQYTLSGRFKVDQMDAAVFSMRVMPDGEWPANGADNYKVSITNEGITWGDVNVRIGEWVYFEKTILFDEAYTIQDVAIGDTIASRLYLQSPENANIIAYLDDISLTEYNIDFMVDLEEEISVKTGETVELSATHNSSNEFTYTWEAPEELMLSASEGETVSITAPSDIEDVTEYVVTLILQSGDFTATKEITVTVVPGVTANAGEDQSVQAGTEVQLDASASAPSNAEFMWIAPEGITLSDVTAIMPTFMAPEVADETEYQIVLNVTVDGLVVSDTVTVTVFPALTANAGEDQVVFIDQVVTLDGSGTVPSSADLTWTAPEGITLSDLNVAMPTFTAPDVTEETELTFVLTANYDGETATDEVTITVMASRLPVANAGEDLTVNIGDEVTLDASASTPTKAILEWVAPESIELSDVNAINPTFIAPSVEVDTEFMFILKVTIDNNTVLDDVIVTVLAEESVPTSIDSELLSLAVYPNPAQELITIKTAEKATVIIVDLNGRVLKQQELIQGTHKMNISDLNTGVYILQAISGETSQSVRLIKN